MGYWFLNACITNTKTKNTINPSWWKFLEVLRDKGSIYYPTPIYFSTNFQGILLIEMAFMSKFN